MKKPSQPKPRGSAPAPPVLTLNATWAAVVLALLVVVFFHRVALEGQTFDVYCEPRLREYIVCTHFSLCGVKPVWHKTKEVLDELAAEAQKYGFGY